MSIKSIGAKVHLKCNEKDKLTFAESSCEVTISVGQESQQGDKFGATLLAINKRFKSCTIMVCDSLQRHTYRINDFVSQELLHQKANKIGDTWINKNMCYFDLLTIPNETIRWDHWLYHESYTSKRILIDELYENDDDFKSAFTESINIYQARYISRNGNSYNLKSLRANSLEYLKEECAIMLLWADNGFNYEIYPSLRNNAMAATYMKFILPNDPNILKSISLEIRTKKSNIFQETIV